MKPYGAWCLPGDIITDEAEASNTCMLLHYATEGGLCILRHRVCLIEDDDFVGWTWVRLAIRRDDLGARSLASKVLDLFAHDADATLV